MQLGMAGFIIRILAFELGVRSKTWVWQPVDPVIMPKLGSLAAGN